MSDHHRLKRQKVRVLKAQGGRCRYCGCSIQPKAATWDHVVPKVLGGANALTNRVVACIDCNRKKGCKPPHVWYAELMGKVA